MNVESVLAKLAHITVPASVLLDLIDLIEQEIALQAGIHSTPWTNTQRSAPGIATYALVRFAQEHARSGICRIGQSGRRWQLDAVDIVHDGYFPAVMISFPPAFAYAFRAPA